MLLKHPVVAIFGLLLTFTACQSPDSAQTEQAQETEVAADTTTRAQTRPKPENYYFKGVEKKRVFICMDPTDDTFHQKHDCPELVACKSTYRNLTLPRAVEAFDRYNCETCSADLARVFDENAVQMETGLYK